MSPQHATRDPATALPDASTPPARHGGRLARAGAALLEAFRATLHGLSQLVFAESAQAGLLVLVAVWLLAPFAALSAALGAAFATAAGFALSTYSRSECRLGLAGFNGAIIGILWGGFLASGAWHPLLFAATLSLCVLAEAGLRAALRPLGLPPLSMPAVVTAMLVSLALAPAGTWFWISAGQPPLGTEGVYLAVLCVIAAAATKNQAATVQALALAAAAMWLATVTLGMETMDSASLWAFAVAPASFATQAVLVPGALAGAAAGLLAALLAAGIWFAWQLSGLAGAVPPLLAPFILGTWVTTWLFQRRGRAPWLAPPFWQAWHALARARLGAHRVVAFTGGKLGEALGVPDYPTGGWRDSALPTNAYSRERFVRSRRCRRVFWEACETLRAAARAAAPTRAHRGLASLERRGLVQATVTTSVDGLHARGGVNDSLALYGGLDAVACVECGVCREWPPARVWQHWDLHCPDCGGLLAPGVAFPGDPLPGAIRRRAAGIFSGCRVLLVIGHSRQGDDDGALIDHARRAGAHIVFINQGPVAHTPRSGDLVVIGPMGSVLAALAAALAPFAFLSQTARRRRATMERVSCSGQPDGRDTGSRGP